MSSNYPDIRRIHHKRMRYGILWCFLSGLPITSKNDYSIDHYYPKSKIDPQLAKLPTNLRPAFKTINSLKGALIPCAWELHKVDILQEGIAKSYNNHQRQILQAALENTKYYRINPCDFCVKYNLCDLPQKTR